MKSILISIRPEWTAKILNGEKTIEIRKTAPKCDLPIDVYIYCTKEDIYHLLQQSKRTLKYEYKVGADACRGNLEKGFPLYGETEREGLEYIRDNYSRNGMVVAKFTLRKVDKFDMGNPYEEPTSRFLKKACVTIGQARTYADGTHPRYNPLYAWHISDLVIFDEPKPLSEFGLERAPQSWQFMEEPQ